MPLHSRPYHLLHTFVNPSATHLQYEGQYSTCKSTASVPAAEIVKLTGAGFSSVRPYSATDMMKARCSCKHGWGVCSILVCHCTGV